MEPFHQQVIAVKIGFRVAQERSVTGRKIAVMALYTVLTKQMKKDVVSMTLAHHLNNGTLSY